MSSLYQEESIVFTLYIKECEDTSKVNESTKEDTVIYIRSKFKQSTIEKVNSSVAKCPKFYHKVWYCLYPFHIIAAIAAFVHIGVYYSKKGLTTHPVECMNICLGVLLFFGNFRVGSGEQETTHKLRLCQCDNSIWYDIRYRLYAPS